MTSRILGILIALAISGSLGCSKGGSPNGPRPPSGPGSIHLTTIPGSATATLDGGAAIDYTSTQFDNLTAGAHQVALSLLGYADTSVAIAVPAGGVATDTVRLRPLAGTPTSVAEVWNGNFSYAGPLAVSPTGNFYVTASLNFLSMFVVLAPSGAILHQSVIPDPDARPSFDIALDSHDNAFVATESYGNVVFVFDANGSFFRSFGRRPNGGSDNFAGIAIGPGDTIHVSARYAGVSVVEKYTPSGAFLYAFPIGTPLAGPIEVASDGTIYVGAGPNAATPQIRKFGRTGALIQSWSVTAAPVAITRGPTGTLYVSSYLGGGVPTSTLKVPSRMEVFTSGGVRVAQWAIENQSLPYLDRHGVDAAGAIYLPLRNDRRVVRYGFE